MDDTNASDRVLALDIRPKRIGYVVLEGPTRLLDWGVSSIANRAESSETVAKKRVGALLDWYSPTVAVGRRIKTSDKHSSRRLAPIVRAVRGEVSRGGAAWRILGADAVRAFFREYRATNKVEIASTLAEWYPNLAWKLPPKRKPWQSEDHRMSVFDAAALGTAYLALQPDKAREKTVQSNDENP